MATPQQQQQQQQARQLRAALVANQLPPPTTTWLLAVINDHNHHQQQQPQQRTTPAPTLLAAATARLLAADLTAPGLLDAAATPSGPATAAAESRFVFPAHLVSKAAAATQETRLPHDVVVQVRDVENLAQSRWQQVQALEAIARGEQTRGRTVVRLPVGGGDDGGDGEQERLEEGPRPPGAAAAGSTTNTTTTAGNPTHRLVLEDAAGQSLYALELVRCPRIAVGRLRIGEKLRLARGTAVARGVLLLTPAHVTFLGGQVASLHAAWVDTRLARLRAAAQGAAAG